MTGQMVLILVGVLGAVVLLGVVTQLLQGAGGLWREMAEHYPAQGVSPDAARGEARIEMGADEAELSWASRRGCIGWLMPWTWFRGMRQVRYAVDDEYLHLETEGGRLVARSSMSIPWGEIAFGSRVSGHMGEYAVLRIGEAVMLFPSVAIERELGLREAEAGVMEDGGGFELTEEY